MCSIELPLHPQGEVSAPLSLPGDEPGLTGEKGGEEVERGGEEVERGGEVRGGEGGEMQGRVKAATVGETGNTPRSAILQCLTPYRTHSEEQTHTCKHTGV